MHILLKVTVLIAITLPIMLTIGTHGISAAPGRQSGDDVIVLFDLQQEQASAWGSAVPGAEDDCGSARLSDRRVSATGLGQRNMAIEATYDLPDDSPDCWAAFWTRTDSYDVSSYAALFFDIRGAENGTFPPTMRVEMKQRIDTPRHEYAMRVYEFHGISSDWQRFVLPLEDFVEFLNEPDLEDWEDIDEIVFVVESEFSSGGVFYLDNIGLTRTPPPADSVLPPLVTAHFEPKKSLETHSGDDENIVTYDDVVDKESGSTVAQLDYVTESGWADFTIELDGIDASAYEAVTFFAKTEESRGRAATPGFEIYVLNSRTTGRGPSATSPHVSALVELEETGWHKYVIPFTSFAGEENDEVFWADLESISFIFDTERSGESGLVYLDNVQFEHLAIQSGGVEIGGADARLNPIENDEVDEAEAVEADVLDEVDVIDDPEDPEPVVAAEEAPVQAAQQEAIDESKRLFVGGVDFCGPVNSGAAYQPPTRVVDSYPSVDGRGCILQVDVDTNSWGAYWFKLGPADLSGFNNLVFDMYVVREDPGTQVRIELSRENGETSAFGITSPPETWQTVSIPFSELHGIHGGRLSSFRDVEELVFVALPPNNADTQTTIYLDNIHFSQ